MEVDLDELLDITSFRRDLTETIGKLQTGEMEKVVITKNGKFQCVLLTPETYDKLKGKK